MPKKKAADNNNNIYGDIRMNNLIDNNVKGSNKTLECIASKKFIILNKRELNEISGARCHREYSCYSSIGPDGRPSVTCGFKLICD